MSNETQIRLKLIIANAKIILNNSHMNNNEAIELLYEIIKESTNTINELRNDR